MRKLTVLIFAALMGWSVQASAVTIDFQEFAKGTEAPLESQGYTIDAFGSDEGSRDNGYIGDSSCGTSAGDANNVLCASSFAGPFSATYTEANIQRTDGSAFALHSFLGGQEVFGVRATDGQTIYTTDQNELGTGDWLNLLAAGTTVEITTGGGSQFYSMAVDNIVVGPAVVPIPAAVWLFGSGLGLLGWMKRPV